MRQNKFSDEKIVQILRESERPGFDVKAICKQHGISAGTFYRWKKEYTGVSIGQAKLLKQVQAENARLKKLVVDRDLELDVAREIIKKTGDSNRAAPRRRVCAKAWT